MAGDPYTIDPQSGTIYQGTPDNLGATVDSIYSNGSSYSLVGSTLIPNDPEAPSIPLLADRTSYVIADPNAVMQVSTAVDARQINRYQAFQRVYGIAGDVTVAMGNLGATSVTVDNNFYTREGRRFYETINAYGDRIVAETAANYTTNSELQSRLNDPNARYLSPTEALRSFFTQQLMSQHRDIVTDFYEANKDKLPTGNRAFSAAAYLLASQSDLSNLQVYSNYWV